MGLINVEPKKKRIISFCSCTSHFEGDNKNMICLKKRCLKWYENHQKEVRSKSSTEVFIQLLNYFGVN
jgi:hypothetical protein